MNTRLTTSEFISKAYIKHGNTYNYSKVTYTRTIDRVIIICNEHGEFKQTPDAHLSGSGCLKCGRLRTKQFHTKTKQDFIKRAIKTHGKIYDYSKFIYTTVMDKGIIICPTHGEFTQSPNNHIKGNKCPECGKLSRARLTKNNPTGWTYSNWEKAGNKSKKFDGFKVYVIRCWNENEEFYKIGKTYSAITIRFGKGNTKAMPYNYEVIKIGIGSARKVSEFEKELQRANKMYKYIPLISFGGMNECFKHINY